MNVMKQKYFILNICYLITYKLNLRERKEWRKEKEKIQTQDQTRDRDTKTAFLIAGTKYTVMFKEERFT